MARGLRGAGPNAAASVASAWDRPCRSPCLCSVPLTVPASLHQHAWLLGHHRSHSSLRRCMASRPHLQATAISTWQTHGPHDHGVCVRTSKCLRMRRIFARISPNLHKKLLCDVCLQFFSHVWLPKKDFICFSANVWRHCLKSNNFARMFRSFARYLGIFPGSSEILPRFSGILPKFSEIFPDFRQIKIFVGAFAPPAPPPSHHWTMEIVGNRSFTLTIGNSKRSRLRRLKNSVPRESVLTPILLNIYNCECDMTNTVTLGWYSRVTEDGKNKRSSAWVLSLCVHKTRAFKHRKTVSFPIRTYGHESCVMTERILFQVQVVEMGFLQRLGLPNGLYFTGLADILLLIE